MRRYWTVIASLLVVFLVLFLLVEALDVPLLADPGPWLQRRSVLAAVVSVGLLALDVVLPVPSSLIMIANGALFGVVSGTLLSLVGAMAAAWLGFALGRRGERLLVHVVSPSEWARAATLLDRWGGLAILVSRPLPLIAETVMIIAGASSLGWRRAMLAALAGSLPSALCYALAGGISARFENVVLVFASMLLSAGVFWAVSHYVAMRSARANN